MEYEYIILYIWVYTHTHIIPLILMAIICGCEEGTKTEEPKMLASGKHKHKPRSPNYFLSQSQHSLV